MSDVVYQETPYCSTCDRYFPCIEARAAHVHWSPLHPECETCQRRFANKNALRNHYVLSRRHHYCRACEKHFRSEAGLMVHLQYIHCGGDSDEEDEHARPFGETIDDDDVDWEDNYGERYFPELVGGPVTGVPGSDEEVSVENEYWDEDDERAPSEEDDDSDEDDAGFAPEPATAARSDAMPRTAPTVGADVHVHTHTHEIEEEHDEGNDADGESDDEEASKLGRRKAGKKSKVPTPALAPFSCPLCLDPMAESSVTRCGHLFCTPCISTALQTRTQCPICRQPAKHKQLRKVYLPTPI